jgi:uncharacterized delta-60 repeat protein
MSLARLALFALLALVLVTTSCSSDDDDDFVSSTAQQLYISSEHNWFSGTETYDWDTTAGVARLEYKVRGFHHGNCRVRVYDATGREVFDRLYWYWNNVYVIGADEYLDIDFTDAGTPGRWTVRLDFAEFSGHVYLTLEDNLSPPPTDPVEPPGTPAGLLDSTFGTNGVAAIPNTQGFGTKAAVDSQGRVLVAGAVFSSAGLRQAAIWRFTTNGTLDTNFGAGGVFVLPSTTPAGLLGLDVDASDRPVATGWLADANDRLDLLLLRLTTAGAADGTFGSGGTVSFDDGSDEVGSAVDHDSGGNVVVAATSRQAGNVAGYALALRYTSTGASDASFGTGGVVRTSNLTDRGRGLVVDGSNRVVLLGIQNGDLALWRFTSAGATDTTFGAVGIVTDPTPVTEDRQPLRVALNAADGSLAVAGYRRVGTSSSGPRELVVWRYRANGTAETLFNGTGVATFQFAGSSSDAAGLDASFDAAGRVLVVGVTRNTGTTTDNASATVWRYATTGALDTTFGTSGLSRFDVRTNGTVTAGVGGALDGSGRLVVAGAAANLTSLAAEPVVWRLTLP